MFGAGVVAELQAMFSSTDILQSLSEDEEEDGDDEEDRGGQDDDEGADSEGDASEPQDNVNLKLCAFLFVYLLYNHEHKIDESLACGTQPNSGLCFFLVRLPFTYFEVSEIILCRYHNARHPCRVHDGS